MYYSTFLALISFGLYIIIILILYNKTFLVNIILPSLRHKRVSGYAEHCSYSFRHFFKKTKLTMAGWLKSKTRSNWRNSWQKRHHGEWVVVKASHGACPRMEEGNVTNNLNYLFLDVKGGRKIDCEASPRTFFCYKWYQ